jgi:hypothetical protein
MGRKPRVPEDGLGNLAEAFEELKGLDLAPGALLPRLQPFFERPAEALPLLLRQFEGGDDDGLAMATSALKAMDDPSIVPLLLNLFRSARIGDLAKGLLLILLEHYGFDIHDPSLIGASLDFQDVLNGPGPSQGAE